MRHSERVKRGSGLNVTHHTQHEEYKGKRRNFFGNGFQNNIILLVTTVLPQVLQSCKFIFWWMSGWLWWPGRVGESVILNPDEILIETIYPRYQFN